MCIDRARNAQQSVAWVSLVTTRCQLCPQATANTTPLSRGESAFLCLGLLPSVLPNRSCVLDSGWTGCADLGVLPILTKPVAQRRVPLSIAEHQQP